MKRIVKTIVQYILLFLGFDCALRRQSVDAGICDFSGQGRNRYGK